MAIALMLRSFTDPPKALQGLLWGEGNGDFLDWSDKATWQVLSFEDGTQIDIGRDKIGIPQGDLVFSGDQKSAIEYILSHGGNSKNIVGKVVSVGDADTATAGDWGRATAGNRGVAMAGYKGRSNTGINGIAVSGYQGISVAGEGGNATAGGYGVAEAGDYGIAVAEDGGKAIAGYGGTALVGSGGIATVGFQGTATADIGGTIIIRWFDANTSRYRISTGYIGENGFEPNVPYKCNEKGEFVRA